MPSLLSKRARQRVADFDASVDRAFDHLRGNPVADRVFYAASALGDHSILWLLLGAARGLRSEHDVKAAVRVGGVLATESILVNGLVKSLFRRTRPPWEVQRPHKLRKPLSSSFPSGHATSSFCAAVLLSENDPWWPAWFAVAAVVASSRVYVRIHHASDVAAGIPLGLALGVLARRLVPLPVAPARPQ